MALERTHKWKFKMKSICTTKKRRRLVQVEWTWCNKLSKDNFKHKLCTTHNLWEEATNIIFPWDSQLRVPKLRFLLFQNFGHSYFFQIKSILKMQGEYFIVFKKVFSTMYRTPWSEFIWPLFSKDFLSKVKFSIWLLPLLLIITHANHV
jgi:hypothetical protein